MFLKQKTVTFPKIEKTFKQFFSEINDFSSFNLETFNRDFLEGEKTSVVLKKIIPHWSQWSLKIQDRFIELLEGEK